MQNLIELTSEEALEAQADTKTLLQALETVIRGKTQFLEFLVTALLAKGHVLLDDAPGLGKTSVAKALSALIQKDSGISESFRRIQFTPDLLPYDISGVDIFDPDKKTFIFQKGPIFADFVLADEINRTTPKVQSALLEAMAERQVSIGNTSHSLGDFFFVIATQNPVETEGTYILPYAQLDRFLMKLSIGYPDAEAELAILQDNPSYRILPELIPVIARSRIIELQKMAERVHIHEDLEKGIIGIANNLRARPETLVGISPRATLALSQTVKAYALLQGRNYVTAQDIIIMAPKVFSHRLKLKEHRKNPEILIRELCLAILEAK